MKKKIKIMFEIWTDPIWIVYKTYTDKEQKVVDAICSDKEISDLNKKIEELYSSYIHEDLNSCPPIYIDKDAEKAKKDTMLGYLYRLRKRIDELNNGIFDIDD